MKIRLLVLCLFLSPLSAQQPPRAKDAIQPPREQLQKFKLPEGFVIELVASEPEVINPATIALDERGRIYVAESHTYRYGPKQSPVPNPSNPIVRLDPSDDGKGWKRTLVAEGFDDPVMGMLIRDGKMWITSNNHLYLYDLDDKSGKATNRRELVKDLVKAWNPFGMFVLEWGPEGLLYLSVGNHDIRLAGPKEEIRSRGSSGIVLRMKPDGSNMEKLVEGLRVPYSFEFDPFGQLWLLSNGQGNPDRFVKVIQGVDYHCYSRKVDNNWLAGRHPLAPPCFEITNGARTQLLHYYGADFPLAYQGRQYGVNWGPHGVGVTNHALEEFIPDGREKIKEKGQFLTCGDVRFRPTQLLLDHDGSLLLADWYGRDDENDLTGRIWRIRYKGPDRPTVKRLSAEEWSDEAAVVRALGSLDHRERERAVETLLKRGNAVVKALGTHAARAEAPLGAAQALWTLIRLGTTESLAQVARGLEHGDWKVRRLALRLARRYHLAGAEELAVKASKDADPAIRLEAALLCAKPDDLRKGLLAALTQGAAEDEHLRYEAAWHLARNADAEALRSLLTNEKADVRLAGLIALDVVLYEKFPAVESARVLLVEGLSNPNKLDEDLLLRLANLHPGPDMLKPLQAILKRTDLPAKTVAEASKLLASLSGSKTLLNPWLEGIRKGKTQLKTSEDRLTLLKLLATEEVGPFTLEHLGRLLNDKDAKVSQAAHDTARLLGKKARFLAPGLWDAVETKRGGVPGRIEAITTLAVIEDTPSLEKWASLLKNQEAIVLREAVRNLRLSPPHEAVRNLLLSSADKLSQRDPVVKQDVALTLKALKADASAIDKLNLGATQTDITTQRAFALSQWKKGNLTERELLGRQVFARANCVKCHSFETVHATLGPSLAAIGKREPEYILESILEPSKVILTGYETELIELKSGKTLTGLVKEDGKMLIVHTAEATTRIGKDKVESRAVQKVSLMPDKVTEMLSGEEMADLLAYLMTKKADLPAPTKP